MRHRAPNLTQHQKDVIRQKFKHGCKDQTVADILVISLETVRKYRRKYNREQPGQPIVEPECAISPEELKQRVEAVYAISEEYRGRMGKTNVFEVCAKL